MLTPPVIRARITGQSLWSLRYMDGRVISEGEVDWSLAPFKGRQSLRLYCPNGKVAELGNTQDATGRLFQLKAGTASVGAGRSLQAHIIGIISGTDGQCKCAAWEPDHARLVQFEDNVFDFRYQGIGRLSADVLGITPD